MVFAHRFKELPSKQYLTLGWSVCWRVWLAGLVLAFVLTTVTSLVLREKVELMKSIVNATLLVAMVPLFHWAGKEALRKRELPVPNRFMGWSIFWRFSAFWVLGTIVIVLGLLPIRILLPSKVVEGLTTFISLTLSFSMVLWLLGWATLRASQTFRSDSEHRA